MNTKYFFLVGMLQLAFVLGSSSCSTDDDLLVGEAVIEEDKWHQCDMRIAANLEDETTTRATTKQWRDSSVLFLSFQNNSANVKGYATYHKASDKWTFNYKGALKDCQNEKCSVVYIDSLFPSSNTLVNFDYHSAVYTSDSIYSFKNDLIDVVATLRPATARVRFESSQQKQVEMKGFSYYTSFSLGTWSFTKADANAPFAIATSEKIKSGFSTPFLYVVNPGRYSYFGFESIWMKDGNDIYVLKNQKLGENIEARESGRMTIPSSSSYEGWAKGSYSTKRIKDITIGKTQYGGWTQTQSSTRTYSNTGVNIQFDYIFTGYDSSELSWVSNPLQIGVSGFDNKGNAVVYVGGSGNEYMYEGKYPETNITYHINYNCYYGDKVEYYEVQFYYYPQVSAKITNFIISTY